jgi:ATP-dependent Clp protease protease subunit
MKNQLVEKLAQQNAPIPQAVIPMVIETSGRGERAFDIFSLLLKNRIILVSTPIEDQTANLIVAQLIYLSNEDPEAPIQMYISSPGGSIYAGMGIYDTMQMIPNRVSTVAVGFAASYGTVLLTAGSKGHRYTLPNATIHMHQPHSAGGGGQATDIEIHAKEILRLRSRINEILAERTGKTIKDIERDTDRDFFLSGAEAVAYGLVDQVLNPPDMKKLVNSTNNSKK